MQAIVGSGWFTTLLLLLLQVLLLFCKSKQ